MKKFLRLIIFIIVTSSILTLPIHVIARNNPNINFSQFPYPITSIFIDSDNFIIGTEHGLFVSNNGGKSFAMKNTGLSDFFITAIAKSGDKYFIGTSEGGLYSGNISDQKWISLSNKVDCPTISSISVKDNMIFVTSLCTGFHVSFDYGSTWTDINNGLLTQKTTSFTRTDSGSNFLGTNDSGLYYASSLDDKTTWKSLLSGCKVTSLSYFMGSLFVGTSLGLFKGNINQKFQKMDFIGGSPYITYMTNNSDRLFIAIQNFGIFATLDGINFYEISQNQILFPRSLYLENNSKKLYIGDKDGNLSQIDLSLPMLACKSKIDLGIANKGSKISESFTILNIGYGNLSGTISVPNFIKASQTNFTNTTVINLLLDTTSLSPDSYTVPIKITSNSGVENIYVSFKIIEINEVTIILTVGSNYGFINGEKVLLDVPPFIDKKSSRTLVPLRFISQAFGAEVEWDGGAKKVTIKKSPTQNVGALIIELWIGNKTAKVNMKDLELDVAAMIVPPGRTMVPLRFLSESFGSSVNWDGINKKITIVYKP